MSTATTPAQATQAAPRAATGRADPDRERGARIRSRREALGLRQTELAAESGLSQGMISSLEHGAQFKPATAAALAAALRTSIDWITTGAGLPDSITITSAEEIALIRHFRTLKAKERKAAIKAIADITPPPRKNQAENETRFEQLTLSVIEKIAAH